MPTLLISILLSAVSLGVAVWAWRSMMADRQQIFDKGRIKHRWATASWGRRIATVLAIPIGLGFGYVLILALEWGAVPEAVARVIVILLLVLMVRRMAKTTRDERDREG